MSHLVVPSIRISTLTLLLACAGCGSEPTRPSTTAENAPVSNDYAGPAGSSLSPASPNPATGEGTPSTAGEARVAEDAASKNQLATPKEGAGQLSEGQVAQITELANSSEVEQGKLAQTKAKSPAVKKFAAMMVKHHTDAKNEQAKLYKQLSVTPAQSQRSNQLKEDGENALGDLKSAEGEKFDRLYIDTQVDAHEKVLTAINQDLIPAASADQKLLESLNKMKATVEAHLKEARSLQATLEKK